MDRFNVYLCLALAFVVWGCVYVRDVEISGDNNDVATVAQEAVAEFPKVDKSEVIVTNTVEEL